MRNLFTKMGGVEPAARKMGKNILSLLLITSAALASCTNDDEPHQSGSRVAMNVTADIQQMSRAMVIGTAFGEGAELGVSLVDAETYAAYDGAQNGYTNIKYACTSVNGALKWTSETPIQLSGTEGKAIAYYPYSADVTDYENIEVDITGQTDWMYSGWTGQNINDASPSCTFTMKHALTAVSVKVQRGNTYTGAGVVSALTVTSAGLGTSGTFSAIDGVFSETAGAGTAVSILGEAFTLNGETPTATRPYMFVPTSDEIQNFDINATIDGKPYKVAVTMSQPFAQGKVYTISANLSNKGLEDVSVIVTDWVTETLDNTEFVPVVAGFANIYAVRKGDEKLIKPEDMDTENEEYIAVALHVKKGGREQKFWIDKFSGGYNTGRTDMYRPEKLNCYNEIGNINDDWSSWEDGAISDFNGVENTEKWIENKTSFDSVINNLISFNQGTWGDNMGHGDWYIPALGQLFLVYLYEEPINDVLQDIGGNILQNSGMDLGYYSSTFLTGAYNPIGIYVNFNSGSINNRGDDGNIKTNRIYIRNY